MLLVVAYVPYKSGGPEVATQAATRLTKLPALPRLGETYGYVFSQVNAPDERWVYDFIARHMSHHGKSAQVIEQSVYYI